MKTFIPAKFYQNPYGGCYIFFSVFDIRTGKLKRIIEKKGMTLPEPELSRYVKNRIYEINSKLAAGWNPLDEKLFYEDKLEYAKKPKKKELRYDLRYWTNQFYDQTYIDNRKKTLQTKRSRFQIIVDYFETQKLTIPEINRDVAIIFLRSLKEKEYNNTTINSYKADCKRLFDFFIEKGLVYINPFGKIAKYKSIPQGKLPFTATQRKELKEILLEKHPQLWLFVQFIFFCFTRPNETRLLKLSDINIHECKLTVRGEISKNLKTQVVAIPKQLTTQLEALKLHKYNQEYYLFGRLGKPGPEHYAINYMGNLHRKITRELGYNHNYSLYSWKATGAVSLKRDNFSLKDIKEQLRHHSLDMTDTYLKSIGAMDNEDMRDNFPDI